MCCFSLHRGGRLFRTPVLSLFIPYVQLSGETGGERFEIRKRVQLVAPHYILFSRQRFRVFYSEIQFVTGMDTATSSPDYHYTAIWNRILTHIYLQHGTDSFSGQQIVDTVYQHLRVMSTAGETTIPIRTVTREKCVKVSYVLRFCKAHTSRLTVVHTAHKCTRNLATAHGKRFCRFSQAQVSNKVGFRGNSLARTFFFYSADRLPEDVRGTTANIIDSPQMQNTAPFRRNVVI